MKKGLVVAALLGMAARAAAHDFWIEKKGGAFFVVSGHEGKWDPYEPSRIKEVHAYGVTGRDVAPAVKREKDIVSIEAGKNVAAVTVFMDNKFWVSSTDGWKNITKREAQKQSLQILETGESYKYGKYIDAWSNRFSKPLGTKMEVVPLANPLALKAGDTLPVQVLLDGKPLESASVSTNGAHAEAGKTDKEGVARVVIGKAGPNLVSASTKVPYRDNPDADGLYLKATLAFVATR